MVFKAHCMSFQCTELLLFNYAKVNTVFHSTAPLIIIREVYKEEERKCKKCEMWWSV